ncbi:hypothetical protein PYCC9005_002334 [Savitreella phatthalungensis]
MAIEHVWKSRGDVQPPPIEVCFFDVFGTMVDWRGSVEGALYEFLTKKKRVPGTQLVATGLVEKFAEAWRNGYYAFTKSISSRQAPVSVADGNHKVDVEHRKILSRLIHDFDLTHIINEENEPRDKQLLDELNLCWHKLEPWRDAAPGILRLKRETGVMTATLSNGNTRLLADMAKYAGLEWDLILSSELFGSCKGNKVVYDGALDLLSMSDRKAAGAMVAAHLSDLQNAKARGMTTVYIRREGEEPNGEDPNLKDYVDFIIDSIDELTEVCIFTKSQRDKRLTARL